MSEEVKEQKTERDPELEELAAEMKKAFEDSIKAGPPKGIAHLASLVEFVANDPQALEKLKQEIIKRYGE